MPVEAPPPKTSAAATPKEEHHDPAYLRIRDMVYQTCGIYHSEEKLYLLVAACKRRMEKAKAPGAREYLELLTGSGYRDVETRELLNSFAFSSCRNIANVYGSSPVEQPALQILNFFSPIFESTVAGCETGRSHQS
ncbi:MAG TPA: hypothetical protein VGF61_21975 [Candidatus Acidoferrum sp.]|jgi:hypothetical protein